MPTTDLRHELQSQLGDALVLERELPRGGMSRVFVATETALGRHVVVKVLAPELAAALSAERFKREISLAARLQHPNIVPLLAAGQAGQRLYYTMPLIDGESLRERMGRERPMTIENVGRILDDISSALGYAHDQGIVHRDMKPENVMFYHGRAMVLDFGIGKAVSIARAEGEGRITQAGVSLGTPTYSAPEQAACDPDLDHRADIYALGVLAYEMLTGHPPFSGRTAHEITNAHAMDTPVPITATRADIPAPLARVVMQCLEKDPDRRPGSALAVAQSINEAVRPSRITTLFARAPGWVPWAIAAVSTIAALLLAMLLALRSK